MAKTPVTTTGFVRYWGAIFASALGLLLDKAAARVLTILGLVVLVSLLCNERFARKIMSWEDISPWWALVPVLVLFVVGVMRAIHQEHVKLERQLMKREVSETELADLEAEVRGLREELLKQWMENHAEHCGKPIFTYPHDPCGWLMPPALLFRWSNGAFRFQPLTSEEFSEPHQQDHGD